MNNEKLEMFYLTPKNKNPVFEYYYNPKLNKFGNRDDWYTKDDYEMLIVDATLSAQEIDDLFDDHYGYETMHYTGPI